MMLSLRTLGRRAPSTIRNLSIQCTRQALRPATRPSVLSSVWAQTFRPVAAFSAFSTSRLCRESESQVNEELVAKIESELSMEKEMRDPEAFPGHLKEYIENSPFEIHDEPGKEEVTMTRTYGDEHIKITFSIDDLNNVDEDTDPMQDDGAMGDELDDPSDMPESAQSGGANTKGAVNRGNTRGGNIKVAPEDSIAPADRPELVDDEAAQDDEGEQEPSFPSHCFITVERPNKGALQIQAVAQDGLMVIENVVFYKDAKLADPKSRADEDSARDLYTGPPFGNLDEDLQLLFEKFLEERGINTTMALFVPEYIDFKEQREYLNWLDGVKNFVA